MKQTFFIEDNPANKISYYHILLFLISLPFDRFYSELILASFVFHTLLHCRKDNWRKLFSKDTLILQAVYFLTIICTLYTLNAKQAFSDWSIQLAIFLFPALFCLSSFDFKKYRPQLLSAFAISCTITIIYLFADAFRQIKNEGLSSEIFFSKAFINHNFSRPVGIHATYLSMYVALSMSYFIYCFVDEVSVIKKIVFIFCCVILFAGLVQLSSKSVFIALLINMNLVLPYFLLHRAGRIKFMIITALISIFAVTAIFEIDVLRTRYFTDLESDLTEVSPVHEESRLIRWQSAVELIRSAPLTGYGSGSETKVLKEKYFKNKLFQSFVSELNTHNEYLSFLLKYGIAGLLLYLYSLGFGFIYAIKSNDVLFFSFMILISAVSISENILDVNKGVFFYSFFFSFFVFTGNTKSSLI